MAAGLAHELNQPLAAISSYVDGAMQLLRSRGDPGTEVLEAMEAAAAEAERAGKIIHRMTNFLRRTETRPSPVDLNGLAREAMSLAHPVFQTSSVRVLLELADDLPAVLADPIQIEQVVVNLVRNALEAMQQTPNAERVLTVRTARADAGFVQMAVQDTGCGLPADADAKLFQKFYTTKPHGMGMGLAISRTIITAHGGRLEAAASPRGGAVFTFTLPVVAGETEP
jgi:C4-dicarboxylate-specific signal transduction histidine kinase